MNTNITRSMFENYISTLINQFFKILPIKESGETSLAEYMKSLQAELIGCKEVIDICEADSIFISLISILQYLIDSDCDVPTVKREVFKAISLCKKLRSRYAGKLEV